MSYCGYIVQVKKLRPHNNADRLQIATFFGNDVVVDLKVKLNDKGIYFPCDLQLSKEFCNVNHLYREKDENGKNIGGFLEENRRVKAIRLRGEKSDGLYLPLNCLSSFGDISTLNIGDQVQIFNGKVICDKYHPPVAKEKRSSTKKTPFQKRITKAIYAPTFKEHEDTEQLVYNLSDFKIGDEVEISLKMHGTSQRTGYLPVFCGYDNKFIEKIILNLEKKTLKGLNRKIYDKLLKRVNPTYNYNYITGTRRTILKENSTTDFYADTDFRKIHADKFRNKLWKGECV